MHGGCESPEEVSHPVEGFQEGFLEEVTSEPSPSRGVGPGRAKGWGREEGSVPDGRERRETGVFTEVNQVNCGWRWRRVGLGRELGDLEG